jgi:hypothetical protein
MSRDPAKQVTIDKQLLTLSSSAYGNMEQALKEGVYRKNKSRRLKNRRIINMTRNAISSRMSRSQGKKGNDGKIAKLHVLAELINANTNVESESPRVVAAVREARANAVELAERAAGSAPLAEAAPLAQAAPVVEVVESATVTITPDDIPRIQRIRDVLSNAVAQKDLIGLYSDSQAEFTRNGGLTMEIGMSRERDLLAVLQEHIGAELRTDIDNSLVEDCVYGTARISIKHVSSKVGTGSVKAKWTSDAGQASAYMTKMLELNPETYTHIMIIYIDTKSGGVTTITAVFITDRTIMNIVDELKETAFVSKPGTNNRGVEYSKAMIKKMLAKAAFKVQIDRVSLASGMDPIERRRALIHQRR